jgi:hypothetical protein
VVTNNNKEHKWKNIQLAIYFIHVDYVDVMLNDYLQLILGTIRLMQLMEELIVKVICH